ncbi:Xaa-Pro peptidase family protein [Sporosarcina sp. FSL K6-2383]|uniref:M24 family metallopeptidase n=1 Tax=Sporosarcina sp. FSL K6-2383 TaxID=2921556 RepID=UPI00315AD3D5
MILSIPKSELHQRQKRFIEKIKSQNVEGAVLFSNVNIFYLTGFHFWTSERPIALIVNEDARFTLLVPRLELEHAEAFALVDHVKSYPEYPGLKHPMLYLKELFLEQNKGIKTFGFDSNGYGSPSGYHGPSLTDLLADYSWQSVSRVLEEMRYVKSDNEIALIKESIKWTTLTHELLQKYSKDGANEIEITNRASIEATEAMLQALGPEFLPHGPTAYIVFRGQIGPMSAFPHAVTSNLTLRNGDTLVTGADAAIWGYHSELERTMFVNEYTKEQQQYFQIMYEAQEIAFKAIKPGVTCSSVEEQVQAYFREQNVTHLTRHHTGHSLGLLNHEGPFLDLGDHTIIEENMIFSIEPGIYVEGLGGFRHSETLVVTENGSEVLTTYPREIDELIC